ncbi:MAG: M28 family peptidase [Bryobacteraceae bacterium]
MLRLVCGLAPLVVFAQIPLDWQGALNRVTAGSLRGRVSFIASDLLEGRDTPSRGLDIAAAYIASEFRRAGLEPAGNNEYFHDTERKFQRPNPDGAEFRYRIGRKTTALPPSAVIAYNRDELDFKGFPATVVRLGDKNTQWEPLRNRILIASVPAEWNSTENLMKGGGADLFDQIKKMAEAKPALVVLADSAGVVSQFVRRSTGRLMLLTAPEAIEELRALAPGTNVDIWAKAKPMVEETLPLRNVAGLLRGSDPALRDTYVIVSGHYDHEGILPSSTGDRIMNGANDDASGSMAVVELAGALASLPVRPKRSIVFLTVAGEEKGLLGSKAWVDAPPLPLKQTVANLNLEHLGRTDMDGGDSTGKANVTGFDFSDIGERVAHAGKESGIEVTRHAQYSARFFNQSDNVSFARVGIPAHTISVGYLFPEYHTVRDHWDRLHYDNYARTVRMVGLALLEISDDVKAPQWAEIPETEKYRKHD